MYSNKDFESNINIRIPTETIELRLSKAMKDLINLFFN